MDIAQVSKSKLEYLIIVSKIQKHLINSTIHIKKELILMKWLLLYKRYIEDIKLERFMSLLKMNLKLEKIKFD